MKKRIDLAIEVLLFIILFSIFINAKAIFNIGLGILVLLGVFKALKYKDIVKEKIFYWYFGVIIIGILVNLIHGTLEDYFSIERSVFFIPLFILINVKLVQFNRIKNSLIYGGLIGVFYSIISYFTPKFFCLKTLYQDYRNNGGRMQSFVNVIRWGNLLQILSTYTLINIVSKKSTIKKILYLVFICLFSFGLIINGTRAGMVGVAVGLVFFGLSLLYFFGKKYLKYILITIIIILLSLSYVGSKKPELIDRVKSIVSTTHPSNKTRLDLYRAGFGIAKNNLLFGTGSGTAPEEFLKFIENSSDEYRNKYYNNSVKIIPGTPFENNYINLLVENGTVYFLYLHGFILLVLMSILKNIKKLDTTDKLKVLVIIATFLGSKGFSFFFPGTDTYVEFINTFLIFYAIGITSKSE